MCSSDLRYKQIFRTKFCIRIGIFPFYAEDGTAEIDIIANYAAVEHAIFAGRVEADIVVSAEDANIRPIEGGCFILGKSRTCDGNGSGADRGPKCSFDVRSEERPVGKEWVSTCRSRCSPHH